MLTKQETLLERVESSRVREPRRTALPCGPQFQFYGDGVSFQVVSGQSSDSRSCWCCVHHSVKMDASGDDSGRW